MINKNRKILFALWCMLLSTVTVQADILTLKSIEELQAHLTEQKYTSSDLIVFDVDMVLTMPQNPVFQMPTFKKYRKDFRRFMKAIPRSRQDIALLYIALQSPQVPTHEKMVDVVRELQNSGVGVLFLTSLLTGSFDQMSHAAEWRGFSLMSAGYDIQNTPAEGVLYKDFIKHLGSYPRRAGHLLMTNGQHDGVTKGDLLVHYLKEKSLVPKRLVMIDDRLKNVADVESKLRHHFPGIKFTGIHYLAASHVETKKVTRKQFKKALRQIAKFVKKNKDIK